MWSSEHCTHTRILIRYEGICRYKKFYRSACCTVHAGTNTKLGIKICQYKDLYRSVCCTQSGTGTCECCMHTQIWRIYRSECCTYAYIVKFVCHARLTVVYALLQLEWGQEKRTWSLVWLSMCFFSCCRREEVREREKINKQRQERGRRNEGEREREEE